MATPAWLLFDLGGVLIENATFERLRRLLPEPLEAGVLQQRWLASAAVRRFELGEISPQDFAAAFLAEWRIALSPDAFLTEFASWPSGVYPGARDTLRALRRRYRIGCLSNCNTLHWERFGDFTGEFDIAVSSHRLGAIKPDAEAFERTFAACGAEPSTICFFDDAPANVDAARRLGARAFHVEGFAALLEALRGAGLL